MNKAQHSMLFLFRHGAYGTSHASGGLDMALTGAAFDQDISLVFTDDGVLQLLKGQNSQGIGLKNTSGIFSALELYEINKVFVEQGALEAKGLTEGDLVIKVDIINTEDLAALLESVGQVFTF